MEGDFDYHLLPNGNSQPLNFLRQLIFAFDMAEVIIIQMTRDELTELIRTSIQDALRKKEVLRDRPIIQSDLLKIDQVSQLLKVSKVTIHKWKKSGRIPFHRISNRIFFKEFEILESLKMISTEKK